MPSFTTNTVLMDPRVMTGGDSGLPVVLHDPEAPVARAMSKAARRVAVELSRAGFDRNLPEIKAPQPLPSAS